MTLAAAIVLTAILALTFFEWLLAELNLRRLRVRGPAAPPGLEDRFDPGALTRARAYKLDRGRWGQWSAVWEQVLLLVLLYTGVLPAYSAWIAGRGWGFVLSGVVFVLGLNLVHTVLDLPWSGFSAFRVEARHGFNTRTPGLWAADAAKSLGVGSLLLGLLAAGGFWLVKTRPETWWFWAWAGFAAFQVALVYLSPRVLEPLFNRFSPLADPAVAAEANAVLARAGIRETRLFQMDASRRSRHTNAYFTGLGRVKRIVVYDTLLKRLTPAEVAAVLAHEAGHWHGRHVAWRMAAFQALSLAGFWAAARMLDTGLAARAFGLPADAFAAQAVVAAAVLSVAAFPLGPAFKAWSRRQERSADAFARRLTGSPDVLASALVKLAQDNLADLDPHPWTVWFHYSHPPLAERLRALTSGQGRESKIENRKSI